MVAPFSEIELPSQGSQMIPLLLKVPLLHGLHGFPFLL